MLGKFKSMDKKNIKEISCILLGIILTFIMTRFFRWALNGHFQIRIDTFYFKASSVFCLSVLLLRRVNFKNWRLSAATICYLGYAILYLVTHDGEYGIEYREYLIWKFVLRCLLLMIVMDDFNKKDTTQLDKNNLLYSILYIVSAVFCIAIRPEACLHYYIPAAALFITSVSETKWKNCMLSFSCGYYLAFLVYMMQAIVADPHMTGIRYYVGNFNSPYVAGILAMGGLISSLYLFEIIRDKNNTMIKIISVLFLVFPCFMIFLIGSRTIQLAAFGVVFLYFFLFEGKTKKEDTFRKKAMLIGLGCIVLLGVILIAIAINLDADVVNERLESINNEIVRNKLMYYFERANGILLTDSYGTVFADGDKINILDRLFAERVSIGYLNVKRITWWGNAVLDMAAHCIFTYWLVKFGWIGGTLLIISAFAGVIVAGRRLNKNRRVYLIPFLWMVYFLLAGIGEQPFAEYDISVLFVAFQYPLLFHLKKEDEE